MRSSLQTQSWLRQIQSGSAVESDRSESPVTCTHSDHSSVSASIALYPSAASAQISVDLPVPDIPVRSTRFVPAGYPGDRSTVGGRSCPSADAPVSVRQLTEPAAWPSRLAAAPPDPEAARSGPPKRPATPERAVGGRRTSLPPPATSSARAYENYRTHPRSVLPP